MKKILALIFLFISISFAYSQTSGRLTIENTNPDFFEAHLPFLGLDFSASNSTLFADFGGKFKKSNLYISLDYRIAYANELEESYYNNIQNPTAFSIYETKLPKQLSFNVGYMISKKEADTKVYFHLKTVGAGRNRTEYRAKFESKQSIFIMGNIGFRKGFNLVNCTGKELLFETASNIPSGYVPPQPEYVRTIMDYTILQLGATYGKMGYWEASIKGFGDRKADRFLTFQGNLLVLVSSTIDPIYNMENPTGAISNMPKDYATKYELNNSKMSKVGFTLGVNQNNINNFGVNLGAEIGVMPGIKGSLISNFSFTINSSLSLGKVFNK